MQLTLTACMWPLVAAGPEVTETSFWSQPASTSMRQPPRSWLQNVDPVMRARLPYHPARRLRAAHAGLMVVRASPRHRHRRAGLQLRQLRRAEGHAVRVVG